MTCPLADRHDDLAALTLYDYGCRCPSTMVACARYAKGVRVDMAAGRRRLLDATGTRRRLQGLYMMGWTNQLLAPALGMEPKSIKALAGRGRVSRLNAAKVAAVYDRLSMVPGPCSHNRSRGRTLGWVPPLAWDDDTIDDPAARPAVGVDVWREDDVDEAVVQRLLDSGERVRQLTHAEAAEATRRLLARGLSTHEILHRYGLKAERYREAS